MEIKELITGLLSVVGALTIARLIYLAAQSLRHAREDVDKITDDWFREHEYRSGKRR